MIGFQAVFFAKLVVVKEGNYFETATGAEVKTEFSFCSLFQERRQHCQDVKSWFADIILPMEHATSLATAKCPSTY